MGFNWDFFDTHGWAAVSCDAQMLNWTRLAKEITMQKLDSISSKKGQLRCGGTWFVGVNFLNNDPSGRLNNISFKGDAVKAITTRYGELFFGWDEAQISICYEGYPRQDENEPPGAFEYRKNRFGAHIDGILPVGEAKRRFAREFHAFIFGVPLVDCNEHTSPVVVWEGSHHIIREYISKALSNIPVNRWKNEDITEIYNSARREVFFKCKQKTILVPLGGSYIMHRFTLHGIMPWREKEKLKECGRMIAYFRPTFKEPKLWFNKNF